MNRINFTLIMLLVLLCSTVFAQKSPGIENDKCSPVIEGIKFCSASQSFSFALGESVNLHLYLVNTTKDEKQLPTVSSVSRNPPYDAVVTDEKGISIPTILDVLAKKITDKTNTKAEYDEYFTRCCLNVGSRWGNTLRLAPYQKLEFDYGLNYKYYFENKGIYYVEIQRNLLTQYDSQAEKLVKIPLDGIKIEIK